MANVQTSTVYNPSAEVYERNLVPALFGPWASRLVALASPDDGERVLDVACGTGIAARTAHPLVGDRGRVTGVDINPAMLDVARRETEGIRPAITWEHADCSAELPFADASFDLILCQQGLQFFADRARGLREMRRVLGQSGRVALSVWRGPEHHRSLEVFDEVVCRHVQGEAVENLNAPFALGDTDEIRGLLRSAGFSTVRLRTGVGEVRFASAEEFLASVGGAYAPLAAAVDALDPGARDALVSDLSAALQPYTDDEGLMYPMVSSFVLARP